MEIPAVKLLLASFSASRTPKQLDFELETSKLASKIRLMKLPELCHAHGLSGGFQPELPNLAIEHKGPGLLDCKHGEHYGQGLAYAADDAKTIGSSISVFVVICRRCLQR